MSKEKILHICQEITPYSGEGKMAQLSRTLSQAMQERGFEVRTFMPRWGCVNERRNQLHEVIRLSGMNIVIDEGDHQLIIKVASIPTARVQIYFIDNDDFFSRKSMVVDDEGVPYPDNDERAIFFARGVLETVKKLRWEPAVVHCHGWFAAAAPIYLRYVFSDDPLFGDLKIITTLYDDGFEGTLDPKFIDKLAAEGVPREKLEMAQEPTYVNVMKMVIDHSEGVVVEAQSIPEELEDFIKASGKPVLRRAEGEETIGLDEYQRFYEEIL